VENKGSKSVKDYVLVATMPNGGHRVSVMATQAQCSHLLSTPGQAFCGWDLFHSYSPALAMIITYDIVFVLLYHS